jgi:tetratricopeptide (TPR) repeat protein
MSSRGPQLLAQIISSIPSDVAASCGTLCGAILAAGSGAGLSAALASAGAAAVPLVLFGGGTFLQICQQRRVDADQRREVHRLESVLSSLARGQKDVEVSLIDLALEQRWLREAVEKGPEGLNAAWQAQSKAAADALRAVGAGFEGLDQTLRELSIVEFDTNGRVRRIEATVIALDRKADQILTEQQQLGRAIETLTQQFMNRLSDKDAQIESLHGQVRDAIERAVRAETARGRPWRETIARLGEGDRTRLISFLDDEIERDEADLIEKHRERAAVCYVTGQIDKAIASLTRLLSLRPDDMDAITRLGVIHLFLGHLDDAEAHFAQVGRFGADDRALAVSQANLGLVALKRGDLDGAEASLLRALELDRRCGRLEAVAGNYSNLGLIAIKRGEFDAAERSLTQALEIYRELGRLDGVATLHGNLGALAKMRGQLDAADAHLLHALDIDQELERPEGIANHSGNLGLVAMDRGDLETAEAYLMRALEINRALERFDAAAGQCGHLGLVAAQCGDLETAEAHFSNALEMNERLGRFEGVATAYNNLGVIARERGDFDAARELWTKAQDLYLKLGLPGSVAEVQALFDELPPPPNPAPPS